MFLRRLQETAPELIDFTLYAHRKGLLLPDTYVIDMEIIRENARKILSVSREQGVKLYYMLKQLGRNPVLARMLDELGYEGAVAVDFREALTFARNGTRLGHVGNLGQLPEGALDAVLAARPHIVTVFSPEKAKSLQRAAEKAGIVQPIQLRLSDETGPCYPGQSGGFAPRELPELLPELRKLPNLRLAGLCAFPSFLCDPEGRTVSPTGNAALVRQAREFLEAEGFTDLEINLASVTCCQTMPAIAALGGNRGEPGHGLSGTTPLHRHPGQPERIGYLYLSEISHNTGGHACCYGGGFYPRGHLENAICGIRRTPVGVLPPSAENIDYYFELSQPRTVGEPVIMCFRTQMFTCRSQVVLVDSAAGKLLGRFNGLGMATGGETAWEDL